MQLERAAAGCYELSQLRCTLGDHAGVFPRVCVCVQERERDLPRRFRVHLADDLSLPDP